METTQIVSIFLFMENACRGIPGRVKSFSAKFSSLLLEPKSNQTDEGAHGYQRQLESVKPSAHLRWLFARSSAHEKNALLSGISFNRSSF